MKQILFTAALLILLGSCQKKDDTAPDPAQVTFQISNPAAGQTFHKGDTLFINATVNYISELHGYDLSLVNAADQSVLFEEQQHVHSDHFTISNYWVDTLSRPTDITLKLTTEIDHAGHEATKTVSIHSQP